MHVQGRYGAAGVALEQRRRSPILEISLLLAECLQHGLRTIAFCKTRKVCELVTAYTRDVLRETAPLLASRLAVYRCACAHMHAARAYPLASVCLDSFDCTTWAPPGMSVLSESF